VITLAVTGVWVALTWRSPNLTYHGFPFLAAYSAGWWQVYRDRPKARLVAPKVGALGIAIPLSGMIVLLYFDKLNGPTFWDSTPSWVEIVPLILIGGALGYRKMLHS